jgi:hypothetical protein
MAALICHQRAQQFKRPSSVSTIASLRANGNLS